MATADVRETQGRRSCNLFLLGCCKCHSSCLSASLGGDAADDGRVWAAGVGRVSQVFSAWSLLTALPDWTIIHI